MGALQKPETVAKAAVDGIVSRDFHISTDLISKLSIVVNHGFALRRWPLLESALLPLFNMVQQIFVLYFNSVAKRIAKKTFKFSP